MTTTDGGAAGVTGAEAKPRQDLPRGHRLARASVGIPLLALTGRGGGAKAPGNLSLTPALPGDLLGLTTKDGRLAYYRAGPDAAGTGEPPLLLVHSINAAGSAYEVRPIFERALKRRRVYALELPGYGFSDRAARRYTPRLMTDAIHAMVEAIAAETGAGAVDALAVSLSCEFLARAVMERPQAFRSAALVSPTGFDKRTPASAPPGSTRAMPGLYKAVTVDLWRRPLFDLLTSRISIRYFLEKTWGSKTIDEGLLDYDYLTTHQPGAEYAPYSFIAGFLFSKDIKAVYDGLRLPVWMTHGVRGDFTDYQGKAMVEGRANWSIQPLPTGALPHFELPDVFEAQYEAFLATLPPVEAAAPVDHGGQIQPSSSPA